MAVRKGGARHFHPFTAGRFPCAVGNVSRSGLPGKADFDASAVGKIWDRPRTCVETTLRGDRDLEGIRGRGRKQEALPFKGLRLQVTVLAGSVRRRSLKNLNEREILKARRTGNWQSGSPYTRGT